MKRLIACALLLAMLLTLFAGCNSSAEQQETTPATEGVVDTSALEAAAEYVKTIYKDVEESTPIDYQRVGTVRIGTESYGVAWSADVAEDLVKITEGANGMVTIDVSDSNPEDVPYVLTATISDANGNTKTLTWNHFLPAAIVGDFATILDMAYALEDGESMPNSCSLTGIISSINTAWSDDYQNITVTIVMEGCEDKPIMCYRLKGEGAKELAAGDQITVTGTIKNYKGTIEFDAGCTLDEVVKGVGEAVQAPEDPAQIMDEAYALAEGQALPYTATLTGEVIRVDTAWSEQYQNITVTMEVEGTDGKTIQCFRLKGDGAKDLWKEDVITVTGIVKNYYGTIEFDAGCQLVDVVPGSRYHGKLPKQPEDPLQIVDEAYQLGNGNNLPYNVRISGYVTSIISPWNDTYHNTTVNIVVPGREDKPIQCYRMHGSENGADTLEIGDYITVFGSIKNYNGTIEFYAGAHCEKVVKGDGTLPWVPTDPFEIIDAAYELEQGQSLPYTSTLTGKVTSVDTPYSEQYKNVTVTIQVEGRESKPIICFRMKGADAANVEVGDTITVTGTLKNWYGDIEFDSGCSLDSLVKAPKAPSLEEALEEAKGLANGEYTDYALEVEGKVTVINTPYSTQYKNITFTIDVDGTSVYCYRIKGDGMDTLAVGDTVKVKGSLTAYNGKPQFDSKATVTVTAKAGGSGEGEGEGSDTPVADSALTLEQAAELGLTQASNAYTTDKYYVTGTITGFYGSKGTTYGNVYIEDASGNSFLIYGLYSADGSTRYDKMDYKPVVGDTITAYGVIGQYNGTAQMKNGWMTSCVPAPEATLPLAQATKLGLSQANNAYTSGKYYVTGTITGFYGSKGTTYGNVYIEDASGNSFLIYGLYSYDGSTRYDKMVVKPVVGDTITAYGVIGQYNGTAQMKNGWMTAYKAGEDSPEEEEPEVPTVDASSSLEDVLAAAAALNPGETLDFTYTITGTISTSYGYNSSYSNITVIMDVLETTVQCYRLTGTGADQIAEGDTITVTGVLGKNSSGFIRFEQGCTLDSWVDNTP